VWFKKSDSGLDSVVRLQVIFWLAGKNLRFKKLRTFLTMLGIVIGLGAVVFLISLTAGLHQTVNRQVLGSRSVKTIDVTSPNAAIIQLSSTNVQKIANFAHVTEVGRAYVVPGKISYQNSLSDVVVYGVDKQYLSLSSPKFIAGQATLNTVHDAIVNTSLLDLIGMSKANQAPGHKIKVTINITAPDGSVKKQLSEDLTIAGVVSTGSGAEIYMSNQPLTNAGQTAYSQLKVVADSDGNVSVVRKLIEGLGMTTASPIDTLNEINTVFKFFTFIMAGFGGIGMIIAVLGMFNTLTISLLERTREIGLMIVLGARKADIFRLLIAEALLLAVLGCLVGIAGAWVLGSSINMFLTHLATSRGVPESINIFSVSLLLVIATLALAVIVGLLVALFPAKRASRINPIDALRYE
jgi:putative ABC transport system permease protein